MNILLIGPSSPLRGGIANFNDSLFNALVKKHEARIISFSLQYPSLLFPGRSQYEPGTPRGNSRSVRLINSVNPFSWRHAADEAVRMNPGCILVHYWMPFFAPSLGSIIRRVKKKIDVPVIGLLHNVSPHEGMPGGKMLSGFFFDSCDGFIAMSSSVLSEIRSSGIDKPVRLLAHPVYDIFGKPVSRQLAYDRLNLDHGQRHLLFFGMIRAYKGLDLLIKAMAEDSLEHLDIKLIVAGEFYDNENKYLDLVEELGLKKKIVFTRSFVPEKLVAHYFAVADLVVLPYISATQSGITQIAYHFEKPMLVTDVGGLGEIVPHGKIGYVCKKDPGIIASSIADFFDNDRSSEFIKNIRSEKRRFSWRAMVEGIEDLAAEISAEPGY